MGLLLAVNQGSPREPVFIIMEYKGNPRSKDHTVVVGKGVTYDTGGLDLKPSGSMLTMKSDMSGAAAAFGTLLTTVRLGLKVNLTIIVAATAATIYGLLRASLRRGRDSFYPMAGASCLITLLILSFMNSEVLGSAAAITAATTLGLAFAQSKSRTVREQ